MYSSIIGEPFVTKHTRLWMDRKVHERLLSAGQTALPHEWTGLLAGSGSHITACFAPARQTADHTSFQWEGQSLLTCLRDIGRSQLQWLGVIHTHPLTAPLPSAADLAGWHYPQLSYWILSFAEARPELRAFQLVNGLFEPRTYELLD